ncbi:MAG TPA: hypothetical protein VMB73_26430 [Acetobacteraceae bacterium]|jgi:hypothetical protein|nr:hypothetical protein [Acetobacteraceae bacterium]
MAWGVKFWHGNMVARRIFALQNNYRQRNEEGICTAASLFWCRKCLELGRAVNTWDEIGKSDHSLNIIMHTLRTMDNNPVAQTELAGLQSVGGDRVAGSMEEVMTIIKSSASKIGIFWNGYHTMGYRYSHHEKDMFDMNYGLFRSKYSKGIEVKYEELYAGPQDRIRGCRIVAL